MEQILIFIIFLGPLVFFHELGHFLFARLFGVKVEVFSIGFGPKLLSFKKGDTNYAISLIPLGGYVKMFGDDPLSEKELTEEEQKVAYTKKSKLARFWIVFGGPLANFILAFVIYFFLVSVGENLPQTKFGLISPEDKLHSIGVRTGDVLTKVNEQEIYSFDDFNLIDSEVKKISVLRGKEIKDFQLNITGIKFVNLFGEVSHPLRAPVVVDKDGNHFLIRELGNSLMSYDQIIESKIKTLSLEKVSSDIQIKFDVSKFERTGSIAREISLEGESWEQTFRNLGLFPRDLLVKNIVMNSAASDSGIKAGDIIIAINKNKIKKFEDLKREVQAVAKRDNKILEIELLSKDGEKVVRATPKEREHLGQTIYSLGVESSISFYSKMVLYKSQSLTESFVKGFYRTKEGIFKVLLGFKRLITGEVSLKQVGGPIAISQVASDSFNISLSMFFRLMAIISINLGIINLFPIPVLDGGHIVFLFLEMINGGPLSRKKLIYAQQVGMSLLFLLIFVALYNDISRFF